jgi:peptidoglycan hydrolase-like protein with peptidoglycan-binding domain
MRHLFACLMMLCFAAFTWAARPATTAKKAPVKKSASKSTGKKSTKSASKRAPAKTWRNRQLAPTANRYRQIQEALVAKGHLRPEDVTGQWGPASVDALKRFQSEQNIQANGKINSLSLIALGLGPRRENTASVKAPAPAQQ